MIISLLLLPIIGVFMLLPLGQESENKQGSYSNKALNLLLKKSIIQHLSIDSKESENELMKKIALFISLLNLLISIYMWFQFDYSTTSYQFVYEFNNLNFCHFHVGVDGISLYFVLLTTFITPICILSN
jgi:NADH-ubiquinone oxidoreductase chain 4